MRRAIVGPLQLHKKLGGFDALASGRHSVAQHGGGMGTNGELHRLPNSVSAQSHVHRVVCTTARRPPQPFACHPRSGCLARATTWPLLSANAPVRRSMPLECAVRCPGVLQQPRPCPVGTPPAPLAAGRQSSAPRTFLRRSRHHLMLRSG